MKRTLVSFSLSVFIHLLVFTAFIYFLNLYREKTSVKKSIISVENIKIVPKKKPLPPKKSVIKEKPEPEPKPKPKLKPLKKPVIKKTKKKVLKKKHLSRQKRKEKTKKSLKSVVKKETDQNITTVLPLKVKYTPPPPPPKESYISTNFAKIQRAVVQNRYYPKIAKRLHIQGEVKASFYLLPSGKIEDLKATGAKKILCKAAKKTILRASQDFPHPKERVKINIPIIYSLKIK